MKRIGYEKAALRLGYAKDALFILRGAGDDVALFTKAWTDFLIHLNGVNDILERSAKHNPRARQWFGGKKNFSKSDELLQYLHQARNADDHGIEPVIETSKAKLTIRVGDGPGYYIKEVSTGSRGNLAKAEGIGLDGSKLRIGSTAAHYRLIPNVLDDDRCPLSGSDRSNARRISD